jgi:hypothetical protein
VALGLACLLACPVSARAQSFVEIGAGWNYPAPAPRLDKYATGYNIRVSLGGQLGPRGRVRFDALVGWFDDSRQFFPPCPAPGCTSAYYNGGNAYVAGLLANWLRNVDSRGILYGIGGLGLYDVSAGTSTKLAVGASAGAGISVPLGTELSAFAETRFHYLSDTRGELPFITLVTFGVRF